MEVWAEADFCSDFICRNRCMPRSLLRNGRCEFSGIMAQVPHGLGKRVQVVCKRQIAQHFLLSARARTLSLASIFQLSDAEAEAKFREVRWTSTQGKPVCPQCQSPDPYDCRRSNGAARYRCRACMKDFSITSETLFASRKQPLKVYLAAIAIFCNELKGKSMLAMSRDLGVAYKIAFVLCHKIREAMAAAMRGRKLGGEGKAVEIDGGFFGGYIKPANERRRKIDRRLLRNLSGKRKCVVILREQQGQCAAGVFDAEGKATGFAASRVRKGTIIHADEAASWDRLHTAFKVNSTIRSLPLPFPASPASTLVAIGNGPCSPSALRPIADQYLARSRSKPSTSSHLASSPLVAPTRRIIPRFRILHRPLEAR